MGITFSQFFPPGPGLDENSLPRQSGKVFIVTGGASGVGFELASILYQAGAKVYIAGRSASNAQEAIDSIRAASDSSTAGQLEFLHLDLADLRSVKTATETFQSKEPRLDVLWNNAGVSNPPTGSASAQNRELQLATNVLGPWLFTRLLLPTLRRTAAASPASAVRVVWSSSIVVDLSAPRGGINLAELAAPPQGQLAYTNSKTANWFLAAALARDVRKEGIVSVTQNPGNLSTNLTRHMPWAKTLASPLLYAARMGAYTELYAGLSEEVTVESASGGYIIPWGRMHPSPRPDLLEALKGTDEGGTGRAEEVRKWCDEQIAEFL